VKTPDTDRNTANFLGAVCYFTFPQLPRKSLTVPHRCVQWLALWMDRQSSVELITIVVAPCAAAVRNCVINSSPRRRQISGNGAAAAIRATNRHGTAASGYSAHHAKTLIGSVVSWRGSDDGLSERSDRMKRRDVRVWHETDMHGAACRCLFLRVERTCRSSVATSGFDPERTCENVESGRGSAYARQAHNQKTRHHHIDTGRTSCVNLCLL
jgi:hypothetical protein